MEPPCPGTGTILSVSNNSINNFFILKVIRVRIDHQNGRTP
jgi:hypothetical protein